MKRRSLLSLAALAPLAPSRAAEPAAARNHPPQKITKIETFILRDPPERGRPESDFVSMTPIGRMTNRRGLP